MRPTEEEPWRGNFLLGRTRTSRPAIVALATAWGPKFGGINSFNTEVVKSLGILPTRNFELICIVLSLHSGELQEDLRLRFHIELVSLEAEDGGFADGSASEIIERLDVASDPDRFIWVSDMTTSQGRWLWN